MTFRDAMTCGEKVLTLSNVVDAKNDAWLLLAEACKIDRTTFYYHFRDKYDLVAWIFGGPTALLSRIVYVAVALAGIWCISLLFKDTEHADSMTTTAHTH